jgi:hypothetical protein
VQDATAQLAAEIGDVALNAAYTRWLAGKAEFGELVRQAVDEFRLATITLVQYGNRTV